MIGRPMIGIVVAERADEREFIHLPGAARHVLANLNAGNIGIDGTKFAAEFSGGVGLHVPAIDRAKAAVKEEEDEGHIPRRRALGAGGRLQPKQFRERQRHAEEASRPGAKEIAAMEAVTVTIECTHYFFSPAWKLKALKHQAQRNNRLAQ
jgi:hypothetical protein